GRDAQRIAAMARARVLIVEDQPAVTEALEVLLDVHGVPSAVAKSPDEAVAAVKSGSIALVIQDMNFRPGATSGREGIELFRRIRSIDPAKPVRLITHRASHESADDLSTVRKHSVDVALLRARLHGKAVERREAHPRGEVAARRPRGSARGA